MEQDIQKEPTTEQQESSPKLDENKIFGILSYISILCLIPLFAKKDDSFIYFHAKQGLVLFGLEVAVSVISRIIMGMFLGIHMGLSAFGTISIIDSILTLINIGFAVLSIIGIINVFGGKRNKLPLIGSLADLIKF